MLLRLVNDLASIYKNVCKHNSWPNSATSSSSLSPDNPISQTYST